MQADFSVELGRDDPALELPWVSEDQSVRYYDLKRSPELVLQIPEALAYPELGSFLARINAAGSPLETAKCDVWQSQEILPEEEIFEADQKFVSYIDLVFVDVTVCSSFEKHEEFAKELCLLLSHAPDIPATIELIIRRCYISRQCPGLQDETNPTSKSSQSNAPLTNSNPFLNPNASPNLNARLNSNEPINGFYFTAYVTGFGDSDHEPRRQWEIAIALLQHALVQVSRS